MQNAIDSHFHIWRQQDQPWLVGPMVPRIFGPYEAIRRDYPIEEFLADAAKAKLDINPLDGATLESNVREVFNLDPALIPRLKEILK